MPPFPILPPGWNKALSPELSKPYFSQILSFLQEERSHFTIYPPEDLIFHAFHKTDFEQVRVVLLGQDPYHGPQQAHGLSFSVPRGVKPPPSLKNLFKELKNDLGIEPPSHGSLEKWAEQGVLLLNTLLTVREGKAASHANQGWEVFTDQVLSLLWEQKRALIFLLWGSVAQKRVAKIFGANEGIHRIFSAPHPSPLSAFKGFFGSAPFSKINKELTRWGEEPINWGLL